jgi:predicted enzyme related to lactoylglutathione lyase
VSLRRKIAASTQEIVMSSLRGLLSSLLFALIAATAQAQNSSIERFGMYVVVADLDRSQAFYERLFQKAPYIKNEGLVGFDIAGGLFATFAAGGLDRKLTRGDNAVPYLRVKDIDAEFKRVKEMGARIFDAEIVREGPIRLFRFADPDGNVIEFFSIAAQ